MGPVIHANEEIAPLKEGSKKKEERTAAISSDERSTAASSKGTRTK